MQPLQPVSIKLVKSMLRIRFMNAFNVLADILRAREHSDHEASVKNNGPTPLCFSSFIISSVFNILLAITK